MCFKYDAISCIARDFFCDLLGLNMRKHVRNKKDNFSFVGMKNSYFY